MISETKILTPLGHIKLKDLKIQDDILTANGSTQKVTGICKQGLKDIYEITLMDGRKLRCSDEQHIHYYSPNIKWRQYPLAKVIKDFERNKTYRAYLRNYRPWDKLERVTSQMYDVIHPFNLGALLADGHLSTNQTALAHFNLEIRDKFISEMPFDDKYTFNDAYGESKTLEHLNGEGGRLLIRKGKTTTDLKDIGLMGKRSWEKHIPRDITGWAYAPWRLELLKGLLATDGSFEGNGACRYSTVSKQLAVDIVYLVRSLGGMATITIRQTKFTYGDKKKKGRISYRVNIRYPNYNEIVFKSFHTNKLGEPTKFGQDFKIRIMEIKKLPEQQETMLISVEGEDNLFVCEDFLVMQGM